MFDGLPEEGTFVSSSNNYEHRIATYHVQAHKVGFGEGRVYTKEIVYDRPSAQANNTPKPVQKKR